RRDRVGKRTALGRGPPSRAPAVRWLRRPFFLRAPWEGKSAGAPEGEQRATREFSLCRARSLEGNSFTARALCYGLSPGWAALGEVDRSADPALVARVARSRRTGDRTSVLPRGAGPRRLLRRRFGHVREARSEAGHRIPRRPGDAARV